jgi:hypothetical protein
MVAGGGHRRVQGGDGSDIVRTQRPAHSAQSRACHRTVTTSWRVGSPCASKPTLALRVGCIRALRAGHCARPMVAGRGHRRVQGVDGSDIVRTQRPAHSARQTVCSELVKAFLAKRSTRARNDARIASSTFARCGRGGLAL